MIAHLTAEEDILKVKS